MCRGRRRSGDKQKWFVRAILCWRRSRIDQIFGGGNSQGVAMVEVQKTFGLSCRGDFGIQASVACIVIERTVTASQPRPSVGLSLLTHSLSCACHSGAGQKLAAITLPSKALDRGDTCETRTDRSAYCDNEECHASSCTHKQRYPNPFSHSALNLGRV